MTSIARRVLKTYVGILALVASTLTLLVPGEGTARRNATPPVVVRDPDGHAMQLVAP